MSTNPPSDLDCWQARWPQFQPGVLEIAPGTTSEVGFLVQQVTRGVSDHVFSELLATPAGQLQLTYAACLAILQQGLPRWLRPRSARRFTVVRRGGAVVAAALLRPDAQETVVEYLVVAPDQRRQSLGRALVEYCMATCDEDRPIGWQCTRDARAMKRLARRCGLQRVETAHPVGRLAVPHHFLRLKAQVPPAQNLAA